MPKIVCISDTHTFHRYLTPKADDPLHGLRYYNKQDHRHLTLPDGDILIHAGDITNVGEPFYLKDFLSWFSALPHKYKIFIAGNHDWCFERFHQYHTEAMEIMAGFPNVTYLHHQPMVIEEYGLKLFGSPYTPFFCDWAFNVRQGKLCNYWTTIPDDTDILITHGPCYGILDKNDVGEKCGDSELLYRVEQLKNLKYHIFGHIHTNGKIQKKKSAKVPGVTFVNASVLNEQYKLVNKPVVVRV